MAVLAAVAVLALPIVPAPDSPADQSWPVPVFQPAAETVAGHSAAYWHRRFVVQGRSLRSLRRRSLSLHRTLLHRPDVNEAVTLAATAQGVSTRLLYRVASCESTGGHGLNASAKNRSSTATGLMQILVPGTWRTTPFAGLSPWSAYASAMAGAWMIAHGRLGEWSASRACWG